MKADDIDIGAAAHEGFSDRPYLVVSIDSHAGPPLEQLRPYCPSRFAAEFDDFSQRVRSGEVREFQQTPLRKPTLSPSVPTGPAVDPRTAEARAAALAMIDRITANPGSMDATARLADMDAQGVASEVIFAGAQNGQVLPWAGGFDAGLTTVDPELRIVGGHMWNEWLADFCSAAPERLLGVAQIPIWDVDRAVDEIHWATEHGLRAINFPAPRPDYPAYNEQEVYEPLWSVVEEVGLPLVTHTGSGEAAAGSTGVGASLVYRVESLWLSRRALGQMIFGEVFDRHPALTVAFVEQRGNWVQEVFREFDSAYLNPDHSGVGALQPPGASKPKKVPSEYWRSNCIIGASFMAQFEAAMRDEIGLETMMWGSDYPHLEGTWPHTDLALRNTFAGIREREVRAILGDNGARAFRLDLDVLGPVVDQIGPLPRELARPLAPDELPLVPGYAFRRVGAFS